MMSTSADTISYNDRPVAIIIRSTIDVDNIAFFTDPDNPLQVGLHHRPKGMKLVPHIHTMEKPVVVDEIQEVLMILSGSIRLTMYTRDGDVIGERILNTGDSVLLLREGHQVEYLEETRMFEVKQGPYPGMKNAKIFLKKKTTV